MTVCNYCELSDKTSMNCLEDVYSESYGDDVKCFKVCPSKLKHGVIEDSQGNPLSDNSCKSCGYKKVYITCPESQEGFKSRKETRLGNRKTRIEDRKARRVAKKTDKKERIVQRKEDKKERKVEIQEDRIARIEERKDNRIENKEERKENRIAKVEKRKDNRIENKEERKENRIAKVEKIKDKRIKKREDKIERKAYKALNPNISEKRKNKLSSQIDNIQNRIDGVEDRKQKRIGKIEDRIDNRIDGVEERKQKRVGKIEDRIDNIENRIDNQIDRVEDRIDNKIDKIEYSENKKINRINRKLGIEEEEEEEEKEEEDDYLVNDTIHNNQVRSQYISDFMDDPSRVQQGTSAMYQNSFIRYNDDMFFVTADGFKQTYEREYDNDEHHPTCQNSMDNAHNITKQQEFDAIEPSLVKRKVGTPCGYEERIVGVKNQDGVYDKLGFVNQEGLLQVFVNSTLDSIPESCPKTEIIDVPDTLWGEFTIGEQIPQDGRCRMSKSSMSTSETNLRDNIKKLSSIQSSTPSTTNTDVKAKALINNLQEMNKQMEETQEQMERMNAIQKVMLTFRNFFKWRYLFFFIGIILLFAFVYSFFSSSKGKQSMVTPEQAQEMGESVATNTAALMSAAAGVASLTSKEEPTGASAEVPEGASAVPEGAPPVPEGVPPASPASPEGRPDDKDDDERPPSSSELPQEITRDD